MADKSVEQLFIEAMHRDNAKRRAEAAAKQAEREQAKLNIDAAESAWTFDAPNVDESAHVATAQATWTTDTRQAEATKATWTVDTPRVDESARVVTAQATWTTDTPQVEATEAAWTVDTSRGADIRRGAVAGGDIAVPAITLPKTLSTRVSSETAPGSHARSQIGEDIGGTSSLGGGTHRMTKDSGTSQASGRTSPRVRMAAGLEVSMHAPVSTHGATLADESPTSTLSSEVSCSSEHSLFMHSSANYEGLIPAALPDVNRAAPVVVPPSVAIFFAAGSRQANLVKELENICALRTWLDRVQKRAMAPEISELRADLAAWPARRAELTRMAEAIREEAEDPAFAAYKGQIDALLDV